jgi:hypothetical protein
VTRTLTDTLKLATFASGTSEVLAVLAEITHADLADPIRLTDNGEDLTSGGQVYTAYPFEISLPPDANDQVPKTTVRFANADLRITEALRSIDSPPTLNLSVVLATDPDTVEVGPVPFVLRDATYNDMAVEATLSFERIYQLRFPCVAMTPITSPGLFGSRPPGAEWPPMAMLGDEGATAARRPARGWPRGRPTTRGRGR